MVVVGEEGGSEGSDYLSLSMSISVGAHPPLSCPALSGSSSLALTHPLLLTSSPFAPLSILFLLCCLADDSKQKNAGRFSFLFFSGRKTQKKKKTTT